jgi:hypothetical protein
MISKNNQKLLLSATIILMSSCYFHTVKVTLYFTNWLWRPFLFFLKYRRILLLYKINVHKKLNAL